eukprot:5876940-Prymnesium_polylepis.1
MNSRTVKGCSFSLAMAHANITTIGLSIDSVKNCMGRFRGESFGPTSSGFHGLADVALETLQLTR